jgi:hypothetical protein
MQNDTEVLGEAEKEHLDKLNSMPLETDEDYQALGELFPEDE